MKAQADNRLRRWLKKTTTNQRKDVARKVPGSTDTNKAAKRNVEKKDEGRLVWLLEVKMMTDKVLMKAETRRDSQVVEMIRKTATNNTKICEVKKQYEMVHSTIN